ncbi:hypothetical protein J7426_14745 [Tropicibacter sp. R16_0]|uniref:hypothetical protein n=1 Tax=Tropicibacter sp. R16_0 TaxID=2821102 RepID=UPI001ADB540D|nr:hypothetical protein [Tropicibacter sp. R16_0]MBO9451529.1 hypothetical protein [Tropicibacter sp. R16_0]
MAATTGAACANRGGPEQEGMMRPIGSFAFCSFLLLLFGNMELLFIVYTTYIKVNQGIHEKSHGARTR